MSAQLPLAIAMDDAATLENFQTREGLRPLLATVRQLLAACGSDPSSSMGSTVERSAAGAGLYLWGPEGVGKSHLLQAVCNTVGTALYLPLVELIDYPPEAVLEGCDGVPLVAIDELDAMTGRPDWQEALFHLFNRRRDAGLAQLYAGYGAPATYDSWLPDLRSRLGSLAVFHIPRLDETELAALLQFRAGRRGLTLTDEVVHYILGRAPRATKSLMALLDQLDEAALARGRAVTVPFINELRVLFPDR